MEDKEDLKEKDCSCQDCKHDDDKCDDECKCDHDECERQECKCYEDDEHECKHKHCHKHHEDDEDEDDDDEEDDDEEDDDEEEDDDKHHKKHHHDHPEHLKHHEHPEHEPHEHPHSHEREHQLEEQARQYLDMAQRLQADFDNYRKRVAEQLDAQKQEGIKSVLEVFLPCLDTFKEAKKSITDEKILQGVEMIEDKIKSALKTLNVEKIETVGRKFDHNLDEVIATRHDENFEDDIILDEFQAGYKFNGKVIRYAKVIVNKL